ncbi:MAG: S-methyl-5'-thioadenosine phosphorylase [Bacteroidetes bacterium]|nr:S-methyl-5'-thioadenosine phosphorylase [Bacteroidota bacterium]
MAVIGLIGGSGLEKLNILSDTREVIAETPYGSPSSSFFYGKIAENEVYILSRHARDHSITPSHVNNRANIYALKDFGCSFILGTTACGSLREEIQRGDIVFPDQFLDFTRRRINTFHDHFEPGVTGHVAMADPFSEELRKKLIRGAEALKLSYQAKGTVVTIEGPRFSTRAESRMFRTMGADIINMSTAPEAALANEAGIPYAVIALSTDYDAWKHDEEPVTWAEILKVFEENVKHVTALLINVLQDFKV